MQILTYVFNWLSFTQCLTSFSSVDHLLCLYARFLILFLVTDEVLWTNPCANVFIFGGFNIHHNDWLAYSGGTDRPGGLCFNLTQKVNFPTQIPGCDLTDSDLTVLLFWIYLFLLMLVFVLQRLSLHRQILIMLLPQFPLTFHHSHNDMPRFSA